MAGTLMVGNIPNTTVPWPDLVADIHEDAMADRVEAVAATLKHWLSNEQRPARERMIHEAQLLAFSQRTSQHGWERIKHAYYLHKQGRRGFVRTLH